jgi:thiamine pyridinylase
MKLSWLLAMQIGCVTPCVAQKPPTQPTSCRRSLVVSLYPAIPQATEFYTQLERAFETRNPLIDLVIKVVPTDSYYDPTGGILHETADVYEVDCVLLDDFIQQKKIQPYPATYSLNQADCLPATQVVYKAARLYAVPHWLCGNFLIYDKADQAIQQSSSFAQVVAALGNPTTPASGLLIDECGKLTLGEFYVNALYDQLDDLATVLTYCRPDNLNPAAVQLLNQVPDLTYKEWGRDADYHEKNAFYPKQYGIGNGRAFVGYSESLYSILDQAQNACSREERCVTSENIALKLWTFGEAKPTTAGWLDALALDAKLSGQKLRDAQQFVAFLTGKEMYYAALKPAPYTPPRYLLPPYRQYYTDTALTNHARLYRQLEPLAGQLRTFTQAGLTQRLRTIGKQLNTTLKQ